MSNCECQNWSLKDLASALQERQRGSKQIIVPMFQRGQQWTKEQQDTFIDSLAKEYPIGTMLFYKYIAEGSEKYILVDGLQRANCIKKYINHPMDFFYDTSISDELCEQIIGIIQPAILSALEDDGDKESNPKLMESIHLVRKELLSYIHKLSNFGYEQHYKAALQLKKLFPYDQARNEEIVEQVIDVLANFFKAKHEAYNRLAMSQIPVIVYSGNGENLPEIFERINSKGTALDQYEIYAASWPMDEKITVQNDSIISFALKKYDTFINDGFMIQDYDREMILKNKKITAFEYLFGLSREIIKRYDQLAFNPKTKEDDVNPIAFELVNACLNSSNKISTLYENIYALKDINDFEGALYKSINFVLQAIKPITSFKGNNQRSKNGKVKILHSKYQIFSMIATTFKEMWQGTDYITESDTWTSNQAVLRKNLPLYYVYDILSNEWNDGGTKKLYQTFTPNRYMKPMSLSMWNTVIDAYFERSMAKETRKNMGNPNNEDIVFLNCLYVHQFTAMDQLSSDVFDIEHIAPKAQMKKLIAHTGSLGLAVASIANLCYLPARLNRSKGEYNIYQSHLNDAEIQEVESKYTFTQDGDLAWMNKAYEKGKSGYELKKDYEEFCKKRLGILKRKFCEALGFNYNEVVSTAYGVEDTVNPAIAGITSVWVDGSNVENPTRVATENGAPRGEHSSSNSSDTGNATTFTFNDKGQKKSKGPRVPDAYVCVNACVKKVERQLNQFLVQINKNAYRTSDYQKGYLFLEAKRQDKYNKPTHWYSYKLTSKEAIGECKEKYIVFGHKDTFKAYIFPLSWIEAQLDKLGFSPDNIHGGVKHWHLNFVEDVEHHRATLRLPRSEEEFVDVTEFALDI